MSGGLKNKAGVRTSEKSIRPGRVKTIFRKIYLDHESKYLRKVGDDIIGKRPSGNGDTTRFKVSFPSILKSSRTFTGLI